MKTLFSMLIILASFLTTSAQQPDISSLSKTPNGQRISDYVAAFNSGDDGKLLNFFKENLTTDALNQRSVEQRVNFQKQVRNDLQKIEIKKILSVSSKEIKLQVKSVNGPWAEYNFIFEEQSPYKLLAVQVKPIQRSEEEAETTSYPASKNKTEFFSTVERYLNDQVKADKFSGVVLIAENYQPVFTKTYGLADKEKNVQNRVDTKFNLGSLNKLFTRIAIGQLVQQGKISFDDNLSKYLPDYPNKEAADKVTIRHLVTMKSGIGDFVNDKYWAMKRTDLRKNSDFIPLFANEKLLFEPGTNERYSNGSYVLLGAIIEKITGKSYYDYVRQNVFKPAGMNDTDSYELDKLPGNTAIGYTFHNSTTGRIRNDFALPGKGSSAGGGYSTVGDFLKFAAALQSRKLTIPDDNGQPRKDASIIFAGGSEGVNTMFLTNEKTGSTIIVFSNYDEPSAEKAGEQIRVWLKQIQ